MARGRQNDHPAEGKQLQPPSRKMVGLPATRKRRKAPNAGGKSRWMRGFFQRPDLPLWKGIADNFWS
jgi:hypothetical protein